MVRARLVIPATFSHLLYPNSYYPELLGKFFSTSFGSLQLDLTPDAEVRDIKWYAASLDPGTDNALEDAVRAAVSAGEARDLIAGLALKKKLRVRLLFLATQDTGMRAPLARVRVPMVRVESGGEVVRRPQFLIPGELIRTMMASLPTKLEFVIDETGHAQRETLQIVWTPSKEQVQLVVAQLLDTEWAPFRAGGCPVSLRIHATTAPRPRK
jgi:hypothetical protein